MVAITPRKFAQCVALEMFCKCIQTTSQSPLICMFEYSCSTIFFLLFILVLTISSGAKIPNCTRLTVRSGAFESVVVIVAGSCTPHSSPKDTVRFSRTPVWQRQLDGFRCSRYGRNAHTKWAQICKQKYHYNMKNNRTQWYLRRYVFICCLESVFLDKNEQIYTASLFRHMITSKWKVRLSGLGFQHIHWTVCSICSGECLPLFGQNGRLLDLCIQ